MEKYLRHIEAGITQTADVLKEKDSTKMMKRLRLEWQIVAMALDRLFFVIFIIAIVLSLIILFPQPYQFQDDSLDEIAP